MDSQSEAPIKRFLILWLFMANSLWGYGQSVDSIAFPELRMEIPESQFLTMQRVKGKKFEFSDVKMRFNDREVAVEDLHLRGKTTLQFRRKSFSVELQEAVTVQIGKEKRELKDFNLLNLVMDKNLWHNRWAFSMLSQLGLFPMAYTYCTLKINNQPFGIYLLVEKPKHAMVSLGSPYMVRRGPDHIIEKDYDMKLSREEIKGYRKQFHELYKSGRLNNTALYYHLKELMATDSYFTWLGFNFLVMNGDYSDELFLYIEPDSRRFEILAWDYDDLFKEAPHEGRALRNSAYRERLIFSLEDPLDRLIASDELLYSRYLESLEKMIFQIDSSLISDTSRQVVKELQVLNADADNREMSRYLDREAFNMEDASREIEKSMEFMLTRRAFILNEIKESSFRD